MIDSDTDSSVKESLIQPLTFKGSVSVNIMSIFQWLTTMIRRQQSLCYLFGGEQEGGSVNGMTVWNSHDNVGGDVNVCSGSIEGGMTLRSGDMAFRMATRRPYGWKF